MSGPARIAFAGTPDFAVPSLERLGGLDVEVPLVLTQPDRPAGRGRQPAPPPVKRAAQALGLRVEQPAALRSPDQLEAWGAAPDLLVVVAYGMLLPEWMLAWPRLGCVNVHASLLPRWRGAAPIQHALLAGDRETGVTLMQMERGLDSGPVFAERAAIIEPRETAGALHDRLMRLGAALLADMLPGILDGSRRPRPQDRARATYAPKLRKSDAPIDWRASAIDLDRRVRAFNPWPVAEAALTDGRRLRIWRAHAHAGTAPAAPGAILAAGPDGIDVATGRGVLRLDEVQAPSSKAMTAAAYLAAHPIDDAAFVC